MPGLLQRLPRDPRPEEDEPDERRGGGHDHRREERRLLERPGEDPGRERRQSEAGGSRRDDSRRAHARSVARPRRGYPWPVGDADYCPGDEYEIEYLSHRL